MRVFRDKSILTEGNLALALAPALTPLGIQNEPVFFRGTMVCPQVLARGLLVLADVAATRYFNYVPVAARDPVLTAQGDRLRAECFSACNGVYARLDLLQEGFDGQIGFGTTNVDIGTELRSALTFVRQQDRLHVAIGGDGLRAVRAGRIDEKLLQLEERVHERPVQMPDRWVRALGNTAEIHRQMKPVFTLKGMQAQAFVASLPAATGKNQAGWLMPHPKGVKLMPRRLPGAVYVSGLHRLSALKRVMTNLTAVTFYMSADGEPGAFMLEVELPYSRLTVSLTAEAWQGYSGEGALLMSLAQPEVLQDADVISADLGFDAVVGRLEGKENWGISQRRIDAALAFLAVSGKLGFDAHEQAYFHRELPGDPDRVMKDNPRLVGARKLVDFTEAIGDDLWVVRSGDADYRVIYSAAAGLPEARCTCTWYLKHQNRRGPCKHILAAQLKGEI